MVPNDNEWEKNERNKKSKKFQEYFNFFMNSIIYSIFNYPLHNKYFDNFQNVSCAIYEILLQFKNPHYTKSRPQAIKV